MRTGNSSRGGWSRVVLSLAWLGAVAMAPAAGQSSADPRSVVGPWVGTYVCAQGLTGLTLSIAEATPTQARALFHFMRGQPEAERKAFLAQWRQMTPEQKSDWLKMHPAPARRERD